VERRDFLKRTAILGASASTLVRRITPTGAASPASAQGNASSDCALDLAE
jgi:hypothetical protein